MILKIVALLLVVGVNGAAWSQDTAPSPAASGDTTQPEVAAPDSERPDIAFDERDQSLSEIVRDALDDALQSVDTDEDKETLRALQDAAEHFEFDAHPSAGELIVGGLAIVFIFGTPFMLVAALLFANYRKRKLTHETISQYLASGKEIPPEIMEGLFKESSPKSSLHKGLVMSGLGIGIVLCMTLLVSYEVASIGLIPLFVGLAQLLIWRLEKNGGTTQAQ